MHAPQLTAIKRLLELTRADQGADVLSNADVDLKVPKSLIVVGHGQSNIGSLVKALKKSGSSSSHSQENEIKETNLSEYQIYKIGDDKDPIVSHVFNNNKTSDLGEWVSNDKLGLNLWQDVAEPSEESIEDPLTCIRPPRNVNGWLRTSAVLVLSLSEGGKLLHSLQSHYNALVSLINPLMKVTTSSDERSKMRERCWNMFTPDKLNQWRIECGLPNYDIDNDNTFLPIPLIVVVTGGHLSERLREKEFAGQRDVIEASLMKKCASIGATLIVVDSGSDESEVERKLQNIDTLTKLLNISFDGNQIEDYTNISPPIIPESLNLPGLSNEALPWIPHNLISLKEIDNNQALKAILEEAPFEIAVTFNESKKSVADIKRDLPDEVSCLNLQAFIDSLSANLAHDVILDTKDDYQSLGAHQDSGGGLKESKHDDLKGFFGDLINKKKDTLARPSTKKASSSGEATLNKKPVIGDTPSL